MAINYNTKIPGVYFDFQKLLEQAVEGSDGAVAIIMANYNQTAKVDEVYEFEGTTVIEQAKATLGVSNIEPIRRILKGGASKVIVYTQAAADTGTGLYDYTEAKAALALKFFEALTFDHALTTADVADWTDWYESQLPVGRYLPIFYGVEDDSDFSAGVARVLSGANEGISSPINAPVFGETKWSSLEAAQWVAGAFAATPLSESLTYKTVEEATDVTVRLSPTQMEEALEKGALVFDYNGKKVRLVSGITSAGTSLKSLAFKQAFSRDVKFFLEENYIGKVQNGPNERLSAEGTLKSQYMDYYASRSIIDADTRSLKVLPGEKKNQVYVDAEATVLETMEQVFIRVKEGVEV